MYAIYALIDPRDYTVHYVGQTSDVYTRFKQHLNGEGSFAKTAWIFELRAINRMIIMETLEEVDTYQEALDRETYWIKHFEMLKEPLSNATHRTLLKKIKKNQLRTSSKVASYALAAIEEMKTRRDMSPPQAEVVSSIAYDNPKLPTSDEKLTTIKRMKNADMPDRDISRAIGLTGRKYKLYQECLVFLGYKQQEAR